jgi:hypothetical protein
MTSKLYIMYKLILVVIVSRFLDNRVNRYEPKLYSPSRALGVYPQTPNLITNRWVVSQSLNMHVDGHNLPLRISIIHTSILILATSWPTEVQFPAWQGSFSFSLCQDWLWSPLTLLSKMYEDTSSAHGGLSVKLTTHLDLVPRLIMRGAVPLLHHTSLWCGAKLNTGIRLHDTILN